MRELVEVGAAQVAWDRGILVKQGIDPLRWADLYFPKSVEYRMLLIGAQGTAELRRGDSMDKPSAVYPTWVFGESIEILEELMAMPVADDPSITGDTSIPPDERPVVGQGHRVVVIGCPPVSQASARAFVKMLANMQRDYPDCTVHIHGLYSFKVAFGMGFGSVDIDPRTDAQKGHVLLPNGKKIAYENAVKVMQWVNVLGFNAADLKVPRTRCMFNIKAALWAGENYMRAIKFKSAGNVVVDPDATDQAPALTTAVKSQSKPAQAGDKMLCDTCSLQDTCKYYRNGAVCTVPGAEPTPLSKLFATRDADTIIDGLSTLLGAQAARVQRGVEDEEEFGELDPEVTKMMNGLFANGVKLAKLVNPALNGGPKVGVFVGAGGQAAVGSFDPKAMTAAVVRQLESQGIPRSQITPEMIKNVLDPNHEENHNNAVGAIEVSAR